MESIALLIAATLGAGTPLALAALGLLVNEKAGVVVNRAIVFVGDALVDPQEIE